MLTLNAAGKSGNDAVDFIRSSLSVDENELKILIDGPAQSDAIKKFLEAQGFNNIFPEDDDGALYLVASKVDEQEEEEENEVPPVKVPERYHEENNSCGVLVSCDTGKQKFMFLKKFISSLTKTQTKPDVIALVNSAVKLAAYNSPSCDDLKRLEASGVQILISESCADRIGMTEAAGVGVVVGMSEILDEIFSCAKVVSV